MSPGALLIFTVLAGNSVAPTDALEGRWLMVQITETLSEIPVVGEARSSATAAMLFDLRVTGDKLHGPGELCTLYLTAHPDLLRPVLPQSYLNAIPPQVFEGRLVPDDGGIRLETKRAYVLLGAKLRNPITDPLPTDAADANVDDTDKDGNPGITMHVEGLASAEVYMATRRYDQMSGRLVSDSRFEGAVIHDQEQTLLGSSHPLLRVLPTMRPDPTRSRFAMMRVDEKTRCTDVASSTLTTTMPAVQPAKTKAASAP
jgi:hypothetical protein